MTKALQQAFAEAGKLSEEEQDRLAAEMMASVAEIAAHRSYQISDEQLAELRRRRADPNTRFLTLEQTEARLRRSRR